MNNTNRALNRLALLLVGVVLVAVGAAVAAAALMPDWLDRWRSEASNLQDGLGDVAENTAMAGSGHSWLLVAAVAVCLILIVLLAVMIFRQGHGRTRGLVADSGPRITNGARGTVIVDGRVAEQAIGQALDGYPGLVSSYVSTFLVRRTPTLVITGMVRRGVSPHDVRVVIDETVLAWDAVLGRETPVVIQLNSGLTSRVARPTRLAPRARSLR